MAEGIRRNRNVKIVATLGPASNTEAMVSKLFEEGVDVFRLNLSHGLHDEIKKRHEIIRRVEKKFGRPICILADLQGPKLRCGDFKEREAELVTGQSFIFDKERKLGDSKRVYLPEFEVFSNLKRGSKVLVNDGIIENQGVEFELAGEIIQKRDFTLSANLFFRVGSLINHLMMILH